MQTTVLDKPLKNSYQAWVVCLSAGLFFFYEFFQLNIFDVINTDLSEAFKINPLKLGWLSSTYLWADVIFLIPAGIILDRYSPKKVIIIMMSVCILGTIGFALTSSLFLAAFFHFLSGIGNAFCFLSCIILISRWFPPQKRALVTGLVVTMAFIGGMIAHTPFAYLNANFGWRLALIIDGLVGILLLVWISFNVKDSPAGFHLETGKQNLWHDLSQALENKQNWFAGIYTSLLNLPIMVLCTLWGTMYLAMVHNVAKIPASNIISMIFLGSILGCPLFGWISDKLKRRKSIMLIGGVASLIVVTTLFLNINYSYSLLLLVFFAIGFFSSTQVISYPLISESNPPSLIGAATAFASVIIMGGGALAQVLFSAVLYWHSKGLAPNAVDFQFAMLIFPFSILVAIFGALFCYETFCKGYHSCN